MSLIKAYGIESRAALQVTVDAIEQQYYGLQLSGDYEHLHHLQKEVRQLEMEGKWLFDDPKTYQSSSARPTRIEVGASKHADYIYSLNQDYGRRRYG